MKICCWGGTCSSGKSTLMRHVVKTLGRGKISKIGLLEHQIHSETKTIVLGSYAKAGFGGTDRLSMAVQPIALGVVQAWASDPNMADWVILFEGDRLFNQSFINDLVRIKGIDYHWIMLEASPEAQEKRHKDRKDTQSESWKKGRMTKALKLKESIEGLKVLQNNTPQDLQNNVDYILKITGLDKR